MYVCMYVCHEFSEGGTKGRTIPTAASRFNRLLNRIRRPFASLLLHRDGHFGAGKYVRQRKSNGRRVRGAVQVASVQVDEPLQLVLVQIVEILVFFIFKQDEVIVCNRVLLFALAAEPPLQGAAEHRVGSRLHILDR